MSGRSNSGDERSKVKPLPVHGFVLAGGASRRMGRDKALLEFLGRPMVEIAVAKLRESCTQVSIVGERPDLERFAPVIQGERAGCGPAAGVEAALRACEQPWAMFLPVDVPLVPTGLLHNFARSVCDGQMQGVGAAFLLADKKREPGFALVRRDCLPQVEASLNNGIRRLDELWLSIDTNSGADWVWVPNAESLMDGASVRLFQNINTADDLAAAAAEGESADDAR